jgi:hypothetical protein
MVIATDVLASRLLLIHFHSVSSFWHDQLDPETIYKDQRVYLNVDRLIIGFCEVGLERSGGENCVISFFCREVECFLASRYIFVVI